MHATTASTLALIAGLVLVTPRRWALVAMMAGVLYLPQHQALDFLTLDLMPLRLLEVAALIRIAMRQELDLSKFNAIDGAVLLVYGYATVVFLLRSDTRQLELTGWLVDSTFCYFIFRGLIRELEDLRWFLRVFVFLLSPYVALLAVETLTRSNPFAVMGGELSFVRGDRIRCAGSFRHPILLGTLGAAFLPLYVGLALARSSRVPGLMGIALCLAIVWFSNSGGPLGAAAGGMIAWLCWTARTRMRIVKATVAGLFVLLAATMQAPVWYLPARISSLTGGGGWHRSYLMDIAFRELDQWWLAGMDATQTTGWFPYPLVTTGAADITNAYLDFGLKGGLLAMLLFVVLLGLAFRRIGRGLHVLHRPSFGGSGVAYLVWGLGCALVVHIMSWLGVTYFDQTYAIWFMQLAAIAAIPQRTPARSRSCDGNALRRDRKRCILQRSE
jgi:hypothetical protein